MLLDSKPKIVKTLLEKGILVDGELLDCLMDEETELFLEFVNLPTATNVFHVTKAAWLNFKQQKKNFSSTSQSSSMSKNPVSGERCEITTTSASGQVVSMQRAGHTREDGDGTDQKEELIKKQLNYKVKILTDYKDLPKKRTVQDFVSYFNKRYSAIKNMLMQRSDLTNLLSVNKILNKRDKDSVSLIGIVVEKRITRAKNIVLVVEDPTGQISVVVNKTKPELFTLAKNLTGDEVIGVSGFNDKTVIFCNKLILPEFAQQEFKKSPGDEHAIFLSDIHVGSNYFLDDKFDKFLKWISGEMGSEEQKKLVGKIKYLFIAGDLVDGVGIYPNQEAELNIKDIYGQYNHFTNLISRIPKHIAIIVCPGNHDAVRLAEPQPVLANEFIKPLLELPNVFFVSNPSLINICQDENFPGFDVLLYHGYGFDYYISNVDEIRNNGGYDRADLVMKYLLRRRHLAPTHASTLYIPDNLDDPLVIKKVPDFFVTGHVHKTCVSNHKHITLICGSCWQSTTSFQEKVGHNPEPARVPLVNLGTREVKILRF
ncbi:DNA-directed DNA polymerase II small subunit [Candidatus Woesearchaeota archaeon]|jgi:DNA polymerase II small subunit|nr:DNA-directed DNA polymerase II small subunit [Candidatus Woesearchaeota archaeon]MBT5271952.1 DNA-directed DNA polymerase II small subunit [Candidatus Woesearchaeota archaeon]MBT6041064.1 DNA-directed DNA polymerase II small subunit [Candidatus Woesearchaeota archaeon]MBT6336240.1 DNA-directed DNA polymerase II small subunit [Candidatus Woesearchaeota archaeon]MBT7927993.1 DNA-directed DNA polymerase II small subunit [Candidatus Woesearchaeota archaeon]